MANCLFYGNEIFLINIIPTDYPKQYQIIYFDELGNFVIKYIMLDALTKYLQKL
jgi:hypothetical protein